MTKAHTLRNATAAALLLAFFFIFEMNTLARAFDGPQTDAGTVISNRVVVTYEDDSGESFSTVSQTVSVTVVAVPALNVTPDETQPSNTVSPRERVTRQFNICNSGNTPDFYTITQAEVSQPATLVELYFDLDNNGTVSNADRQVRIGQGMSPRLMPGACLGVLAVIDTNDSPAQSNLTIRLTARSNVANTSGGMNEDDGTIINSVGDGARVTDPNNTSLPPSKLVEDKDRFTATNGQTLHYTIAFRNSGGVTARGVHVVDELPAGLEYIAGSLELGGLALTDAPDTDAGAVVNQRIEVRLAEVAPGEVVRINFRAHVTGGSAPGLAIINTARISGDNFDAASTTNAVVVVDPFGTVYAGHSGGAVRIGGARVTMWMDQSGTMLELPQGAGFVPNEANDNPFSTDGQGHFSFALKPEQLGTSTNPAHYFVNVTAPNYRGRMLELTLNPVGNGVFAATVRALDEQPIAQAGSFQLSDDPVQIENIASIAFNIPLFEVSALEITKNADKQQVEIGDVVTYRVSIRNATASTLHNVTVQDQLPQSFHYVEGTARLDDGPTPREVTPEVNADGSLLFNLGQLKGGATVTLLYRVRVGVNAHEGDQFNSAVATGFYSTGERTTTTPARAGVRVGRGVFSTRQVIVGRVFVDSNNNGLFDKGEKPVAGVRIYLNNGQSVITDSAGQYNIPSIGEGSVVLSLDPITVPTGYLLADENRRADKSWTRLLRTPLGGGALLRQNFALVSSSDTSHASGTNTDNTSALAGNDSASLNSNARSAGPFDGGLFAGRTGQSGASNRAANSVNGVGPNTARDKQPLRAGEYETAAPENVTPVDAGEVLVASPSENEVIISPALSVEAHVAEGWSVALEINGQRVARTSIGEQRVDHKNKISSFTFVGINLRPGPNQLKVTALGPDGSAGRSIERVIYGRGPAKRLEIVPAKNEVQAGGRDATLVVVRAFDQWGHPAADGQVAVQTSAGRLLARRENLVDEKKAQEVSSPALKGAGTNAINAISAEQVNQNSQQQLVQLSGGEAVVELIAEGNPATAKLQASTGELEAEGEVRIVPEVRPTLLVGLAEVSVGKAAPEISVRGDDENVRSRIAFFFRGSLFGKNLVTVAYDSQRPLNRTAGRDRLFQLDPLDRVYPIFGDSSTRFEDAQSNSKLYARLDRGRSYAMFGDFDADLERAGLASYGRKLTGVKLHAENASGDFITVTGARPDTAFARDVLPGGALSLQRLSHFDILPGSETVMLEVRDRRNPEIILSREMLVRSVDYNLNAATGEIFFLRPISTFDYQLNLLQTVVTYEYRANDMTSAVYTGRAQKRFGQTLRLGLSVVDQQQSDFGSFLLGGLDGELSLPNHGKLGFAYARSQGRVMGGGNVFFGAGEADREHNGNAYRLDLEQPLPFYEGVLRAGYSRSDEDFLNPFGQTVAPGAQRAGASLELRPRSSRSFRFSLLDERNRTANVNNSRLTMGIGWNETWSERFRTFLSYDHRQLNDELGGRETTSNLLTAGVEYRPTEKIELSVKREQNIGDPDPSYPDQTTLTASYKVSQTARLFFTQRLASAPIVPIADVAGTGFAATGSRHETAIGVESQFGKYTSMTGRYQLENGINGTDSFAVIGLQNRLPISQTLSLDLQYERGFHLAGNGESFNNGGVGFSWQPTQNFRSSARYELRDRNGLGQLLTLGAAGRLGDGVTALAQVQWGRAVFEERGSSSFNATAALALRPLESDRVGLLFSYTRRSLMQEGGRFDMRDRSDTLSSDGYYQATQNLELYGRFALKLSGNGDSTLPYASATTLLGQGRAQYRLGRYFDFAGETRSLWQPASQTRRTSYGAELGFWAMSDLRLGGGYNFTTALEPRGSLAFGARRGFYFNISSKLSNLFDLFGTSRQGLASDDSSSGPPAAATQQPNEGRKN